MTQSSRLFTSESVTEGHPDKICDGISDALLDALLAQDADSRVACETMVTTGMIIVAGEITSNARIDYSGLARDKVRRIGYIASEMGFDAETCAVLLSLDRQSPDISMGVSSGQGRYKEQGAGDQGMMFGYACDETRSLMPAPINYAHRLTRELTRARRSGRLPFLRPDGKSQVSVRYENGRAAAIDAIVVSSQHSANVKDRELREGVIEEVVKRAIPAGMMPDYDRVLINPTGRFVIGGPQGDCGLTGRKIIVDTYGGMGRHGGGAFSGKDPSKVDRSAAYMARYVAKNIVAAKLARRCEVQLAYAIGYAQPVSVAIDTFGTSGVPERELVAAVREVFPLTPAEIVESLQLKRPIYEATSAYGHFGRTAKRELESFTWERTDRAEKLAAAVG